MASKGRTLKTGVKVRPYQPRDLSDLMVLFRDSVHRIAQRHYTPEQLSAWAPPDPDRDAWAKRIEANHTLVAEEKGVPVGFAELTGGGHLDMLFVAPDRRRRGVARALLRAIEAQVAHWGRRHMTTDASRTAKPFFLKAGFRLVEAQEVHRRGVAIQNFRMEKEI
jgi:GNAT superfamily N-acetyltransferase